MVLVGGFTLWRHDPGSGDQAPELEIPAEVLTAATAASGEPTLVSNRTDFDITLKIEPNQIGQNQVQVLVKDQEGNMADLESVSWM